MTRNSLFLSIAALAITFSISTVAQAEGMSLEVNQYGDGNKATITIKPIDGNNSPYSNSGSDIVIMGKDTNGNSVFRSETERLNNIIGYGSDNGNSMMIIQSR